MPLLYIFQYGGQYLPSVILSSPFSFLCFKCVQKIFVFTTQSFNLMFPFNGFLLGKFSVVLWLLYLWIHAWRQNSCCALECRLPRTIDLRCHWKIALRKLRCYYFLLISNCLFTEIGISTSCTSLEHSSEEQTVSLMTQKKS